MSRVKIAGSISGNVLFLETVFPRNTTQRQKKGGINSTCMVKEQSSYCYMVMQAFLPVYHLLREEAVEIGEANDSNDGTAQRNHHLFLLI